MNLPFSNSPLQRFGWLGIGCGGVLCTLAYALGLVESGGYFNDAALYAFRYEYTGHWYKAIGRLGVGITIIAAAVVVFGPHLMRAFYWAASGAASSNGATRTPTQLSPDSRAHTPPPETLHFKDARAAIEYASRYLNSTCVPGRTVPAVVEMVKLDTAGVRSYTVAFPGPKGTVRALVRARDTDDKFSVGDLVAVEVAEAAPSLKGAITAHLSLEYHVREGWKQQIH